MTGFGLLLASSAKKKNIYVLLFEQKPDFLCLCKEMEHNLMEVMIESALDAIKQKISVKMHLPQSSLLVFLTLLIFL